MLGKLVNCYYGIPFNNIPTDSPHDSRKWCLEAKVPLSRKDAFMTISC
jgi:hypothetical protein